MKAAAAAAAAAANTTDSNVPTLRIDGKDSAENVIKSTKMPNITVIEKVTDPPSPSEKTVETYDDRLSRLTFESIDSAAVLYLLGTEMDYKKEEFSSSFVFNNPNETERCGCGESFKV